MIIEAISIDKQGLILRLDGPIVTKARPRFRTGQGGYLPQRYRDWKEAAIADLLCQTHGLPDLPFQQVTIDILIQGKATNDLDNIAGAVLDALVQAGVLKDDRVSCVPALSLKYLPGKQSTTTITLQ